MIVLTFKDSEEKILEKTMRLLANDIHLETVPPIPFPVLSYPGLEIKQHQRRVLRDGEEVSLTRLEYGTLIYLASNAGMILSQEQIFEAVWHIDCDTCHTSVVNTIYTLRKKIEPNRQKPYYIKTVPSMGYIFNPKRTEE